MNVLTHSPATPTKSPKHQYTSYTTTHTPIHIIPYTHTHPVCRIHKRMHLSQVTIAKHALPLNPYIHFLYSHIHPYTRTPTTYNRTPTPYTHTSTPYTHTSTPSV